MSVLINFTLNNFLSTSNSQYSDLLTQLFTSAMAFSFDFLMTRRDDFLAFFVTTLSFVLNDLCATFLSLLNDFSRLLLRLFKLFSDVFLGFF